MSASYSTNYRVPPADQRARRVPAEYRRTAVKCDSDWNGTPAGVTGAFEGYLASLPPVLGLGFGAFGEWSSEVDTLIGECCCARGIPPLREFSPGPHLKLLETLQKPALWDHLGTKLTD